MQKTGANMVKIVTDTTSGLSPEDARAHGVFLVPQIVNFGEESYRDDSELDTETFLRKLRASNALPQTAAPPPALYDPIFSAAAQNNEPVICIHPSAKISGTVRSATIAAQNHPDADICIVDTQTIAGTLATLVLLAAQWAADGLSAEIICGSLEDMIAQQRIYFLVDTLEYLQKGGRIGGARALLGEILRIKPILTMRAGQVEPFEQARTKHRALARLAELVQEQAEKEGDPHVCVMHADAPDDAQTLVAQLKSSLNLPEIPIYTLPPAIIVHAGPGALAVGFFTNQYPPVIIDKPNP
ncbi:MAG: DegV family protein [Anaerolineales bacterium]|nr:DegV family protein [Anaerolineales bacterium]